MPCQLFHFYLVKLLQCAMEGWIAQGERLRQSLTILGRRELHIAQTDTYGRDRVVSNRLAVIPNKLKKSMFFEPPQL